MRTNLSGMPELKLGLNDKVLFEKHCGKLQYAFATRNSYFIIFNNEDGTPDLEWLEKELKNGSKYDHIFIALHKPPFDPYQQEWYNVDNTPWAYKFRKICAEYDVDIVFSGHKHMFQRNKFDGVENVCTGGGGMLIEIPESDGGYLHYVRVMEIPPV